jgi:hypothetical protein
MAEKQEHSGTGSKISTDCPPDRQNARKYQVSTNRGHARHKVRYVESGGGEADPNCRLCTPVIKLKD